MSAASKDCSVHKFPIYDWHLGSKEVFAPIHEQVRNPLLLGQALFAAAVLKGPAFSSH
jgi:hypothetical protein